MTTHRPQSVLGGASIATGGQPVRNEAWQAAAYAFLNYPEAGEIIGNFMGGRFASTTMGAHGSLLEMQLQQSLATAIATGVSEKTATGVGSHGRRKHRHRRRLPPALAKARTALKSMKVMQGTKDLATAIKIIKDKKKKLQSEEDKLHEKRCKHLDKFGYRLMLVGSIKLKEKKAEKAAARDDYLRFFYGMAWN